MNSLKPLFRFTKGQRKGVLFLIITIAILLICIYYARSRPDVVEVNYNEIKRFQKEIDSLKLVKADESKPRIYPFNPNFITDYKGYTLGMSNSEIDRLLEFRKQDRWINSAKQFQEVTKISDSLLIKISPYFKFPDWVTNPKPKTYNSNTYSDYPRSYDQKIDLNLATQNQLKQVNGIGDALSKRIIDFRNKQENGFISDVQLQEVYGLSLEVIERIKNRFTVKEAAQIKPILLNTATRDELVSIKYLDYEIAHNIIEYRTLHEGFKSLEELKNVKEFPASKFDLIALYLQL